MTSVHQSSLLNQEASSISEYTYQDKYSVYDYICQYNGNVYTANSLEECQKLATNHMLTNMSRVIRAIKGPRTMYIGKITQEHPFTKISFTSYSRFCVTLQYGNKSKEWSIFSATLANTNLLCERMECIPYHLKYKSEDKVLNIFAGIQATYMDMSYEKAKEICMPLLQYILIVWCNDNLSTYTYVLEWLATCLRDFKRNDVGLVITGLRECELLNFIGKYVLGPNMYEDIYYMKNIKCDKLLFHINEQDCKITPTMKTKMMGYVTDTSVSHKLCGSIKNYSNYIITTGKDKSIFMDNERYYIVKAGRLRCDISPYCTQEMGNAFYTFMRHHTM